MLLFKKLYGWIPVRYKYQQECLNITFIYLTIGILWIFFSDRIAFMLSPSKSFFLMLNTYKGLFYVLTTSVILYLLLKSLLIKVEQSEKDNLYLSYHDVLTGLYNRRYYELEIKRMDNEKNLPISIVIADVNGLKLINDAFGHQLGDQLLQKAAETIRAACRARDVAARWGGDEFIILLPATTREEAEAIVDRIKENISGESVGMINVSMSLGWDTKESMDRDFAEILKNAEDSMYKNKIIQNHGLRGNLINTIINTLHEKNPREERHSDRVGDIAQKIGEAIGFSETEIRKLKLIGHLHDIGKIAIEESILNKEGKLTKREQEEIQRHPDIGYRILGATSEMLDLANCVLCHHERWDGLGYPRGISGQEIPIEARIIALADSYDAMSSERPYRKALDEDVVFYEIRKNAGFQFDPDIARVFVEKVMKRPWN